MIKLIRKGFPKVIEYTCTKCGSLFSFEKEDLIEKEIDKKRPYLNKFSLSCPGCHKEIIFNNDDYPFRYKEHNYYSPLVLAKCIEKDNGEIEINRKYIYILTKEKIYEQNKSKQSTTELFKK